MISTIDDLQHDGYPGQYRGDDSHSSEYDCHLTRIRHLLGPNLSHITTRPAKPILIVNVPTEEF